MDKMRDFQPIMSDRELIFNSLYTSANVVLRIIDPPKREAEQEVELIPFS